MEANHLSLLFLLLLFFLFFLLLIRALLLGRQPLRKNIMIHMTWYAVWYCFRVPRYFYQPSESR